MTRAASVFALLLAAACSGSTDSSTGADGTGGGDSADELRTGARFTSLKKPTDKDLAALYAAGEKIDGKYNGVFRFNKAGPEATDPDARFTRIREVMHRYMCRFFDDSIDLSRSSTPAWEVKDTMTALNFDRNVEDKDAQIAAYETALKKVANNPNLDLMSGSAGGNNTGGDVMGVYDIAHNEILFYGFTNCGSDD